MGSHKWDCVMCSLVGLDRLVFCHLPPLWGDCILEILAHTDFQRLDPSMGLMKKCEAVNECCKNFVNINSLQNPEMKGNPIILYWILW